MFGFGKIATAAIIHTPKNIVLFVENFGICWENFGKNLAITPENIRAIIDVVRIVWRLADWKKYPGKSIKKAKIAPKYKKQL